MQKACENSTLEKSKSLQEPRVCSSPFMSVPGISYFLAQQTNGSQIIHLDWLRYIPTGMLHAKVYGLRAVRLKLAFVFDAAVKFVNDMSCSVLIG